MSVSSTAFLCNDDGDASHVLEAEADFHRAFLSLPDEAVIKGYCREGNLETAKEWLERAKVGLICFNFALLQIEDLT